MSEELAISLRGVSKCFKRYDRPVDRLKELLIPGKSRAQEFWALRDIDLDVPKGQTLGIVGRNGSGKSTLLQIIAGTLTPTKGTVQVNGRVSALLELGSGFNPEFTGRQNVFFNGQLLGLTKGEVEERFDEIAAFADIGDFIDQPVKTYSSGMFVRLAFAVAVHVDPEILIIDEALAVGDMFFQAKCMSLMQRLISKSVTVIFVSHDLNATKSLCKLGLWIDKGKMQAFDLAQEIVKIYSKNWVDEQNSISSPSSLKENHNNNISLPENSSFRTGNGKARIAKFSISSTKCEQLSEDRLPIFSFNEEVHINLIITFLEKCKNISIAYHIKNFHRINVIGFNSYRANTDIYHKTWHPNDKLEITFKTSLPLIHGNYSLNLLISSFTDTVTFADAQFLDWIEDAKVFQIEQAEPIQMFDLVDIPSKVVQLSCVCG